MNHVHADRTAEKKDKVEIAFFLPCKSLLELRTSENPFLLRKAEIENGQKKDLKLSVISRFKWVDGLNSPPPPLGCSAKQTCELNGSYSTYIILNK